MTIKKAIDWVMDTYRDNVFPGMDAKSVRIAAPEARWVVLKFPGERWGYNKNTGRYEPIRTEGDYCAEYKDKEVSHLWLCNYINYQLVHETISYSECIDILDEIYVSGLNYYEGENSIIRRFKGLIFWVSLQEEINYPRGKRYLGRQHALLRYAEAAISTANGQYDENEMYRRTHTKNPRGLKPIKNIGGYREPRYYHW